MKKQNIRFWSLVLVLAMSLALSAPALAAEEIPSGLAEDPGITDPVQEPEAQPEVEPDTVPTDTYDPATGIGTPPDETEAVPDEAENDPAVIDENTPPDEEVPPELVFDDVLDTHGFYTAIMDCANKGITSGYADGTFRPTNSVTRAQFCVMLARAFYPYLLKSYDTDKNKAIAWFYPATKTLNDSGVLSKTSFTSGYNSSITMDQPISRYDMAALMTNIMAAKGFTATAAQKTEAQKKIADYKSIPSQYQNAVKNVFALGIITGYGDGTFGGNKNMNRGQGCVVIYRMMQYTPAANTGSSSGDTSYDDGKTKPSTGSSNTGSSNTGSTGNNNQTTTTSNTLANGKPVTEANVLAMIQELLKKYPDGTAWGPNTSRPGIPSNTVASLLASRKCIVNGVSYNATSATKACSGFASLISDSIFGSGNAMPARKVELANARPGDILLVCNKNGEITHVEIAASRATKTTTTAYDNNLNPIGTYPRYKIDMYSGNTSNCVKYGVGHLMCDKTMAASNDPTNPTGGYVECWTRYPN